MSPLTKLDMHDEDIAWMNRKLWFAVQSKPHLTKLDIHDDNNNYVVADI